MQKICIKKIIIKFYKLRISIPALIAYLNEKTPINLNLKIKVFEKNTNFVVTIFYKKYLFIKYFVI